MAHETLKIGQGGFGEALAALKTGQRVARSGWDGKGMWLALYTNPEPRKYVVFAFNMVSTVGYELADWIGMKTADDKFVPWLASQTDLLAMDWQIVD